MPQVKVFSSSQLAREKWDLFVRSHPNGTIFHSSSWHRTIERCYRYMAQYHLVFSADGEIRSAIPSMKVRNLFLGKRTVCFPYSDHCDPLLGDETDLIPLLESVAGCGRTQEPGEGIHEIALTGGGKLEFRFFNCRTEVPGLNSDRGYVNYVVDLGSGDRRQETGDRGNKGGLDSDVLLRTVWDRLDKSCIQRQVRKAERLGVKVRVGKSLEDLKAYFRLHLETRRRQGVPSQPFKFFEFLKEEFRDSLVLLLAEADGKANAGMILLSIPDTLQGEKGDTEQTRRSLFYKFGASGEEGRKLGSSPLLFWKAMQIAVQRGYRRLDLGRTSAEPSGLGAFKSNLGTVPAPLYYWSTDKAHSQVGDSKFQSLGSRMYSFNPLVGRLFGRLLYRYLG